MATPKPEIADAEAVMNKVIGRSIADFGLDHEGLHIFLNDGQTLIFMGVLCLMPSENGSH